MLVKTQIGKHARQRIVERLGIDALDDLTQNFSFSHAPLRYVDCKGHQHIYDRKYQIELVGFVRRGWFVVKTVIKMPYQSYCARRAAMTLRRF